MIPFIDLKSQQDRIAKQLQTAIQAVMEHGQYILGPEVKAFEKALSDFEGGGEVIGCANGTDALILPMMAWGIGKGDAVFCPSFTYTATAEAIAILGAVPVFVDIDRELYTMTAKALENAIQSTLADGTYTPKAIIAVDLFGQPANYEDISPIAKKYGLKLIADSAQALGCRLHDVPPLKWADVTTTSFFPAKPLGCYGDGGALITHDKKLAEQIRRLAFHGRGTEPYEHDAIGMNSRLDTIQAAILLEKLKIFSDEIDARNQIASYYNEELSSFVVKTPKILNSSRSTWAQYCIEVPNRDAFMATMRAASIPVAAYYPKPIHQQKAYRHFPVARNGLAATEDAMKTICALPMHPYLDTQQQDIIVSAVKKAIEDTKNT